MRTQTPWEWGWSHDQQSVTIYQPTGLQWHIAYTANSFDKDTQEDNAKFIVEAVNSHEELKSTLTTTQEENNELSCSNLLLLSKNTALVEEVARLREVLKNIAASIDAPYFDTKRKYAIRNAALEALRGSV